MYELLCVCVPADKQGCDKNLYNGKSNLHKQNDKDKKFD